MLTQAREQFLTVWNRQSNTQKIVLSVLVVTAIVLIALFLMWANTPSYAVAFSGLSDADAGQIVNKLDELGVPYQLRNGSTIMVPSNQVYQVRLRMATDGLPQGGTVGFELFSGNTFGMTDFTEKVNYQRALEGELERTIGSLSAVASVSVHIVTPDKTLLSGDQNPTTASITLQEKPGAQIDASQVQAITHLVASSVEGLKPENVVVVDVNGNLLASGSIDGETSMAAQSDSHQAVEQAAAANIQKKVQTILDSALGPNRSVVKANVTMDWTQRETTQQSYDPSATAVRSSQLMSETYTTDGTQMGGIPGASSNLPPIASVLTNTQQAGLYQHNEKTINYEITQVQSHEVATPGKIEKVSLSVLVDGVTDPNQLSALKSVIGAAAGIDETRGDTLAIQSMTFDRSYSEQQAADMNASQRNDLYIRIGEVVLGAIALLALLWYVQRLLSNIRLASSRNWKPILKPVAEIAGPMASMGAPMEMAAMLDAAGKEARPLSEPKSRYEVPVPVISEEDEHLQRLVVKLAGEDPSTVAEIIQMWLNEDER
jgi:flagellar M-ring protein FliF